MSKQGYNTSDVDDTPPPAYQETPPFNPNYSSSSSNNYQSPPFNPHYVAPSSPPPPPPPPQQQLYPQIPVAHFPQPGYQTIQIPHVQPVRRRDVERRGFPLAAIFFLFGWFCPILWIIGACCCAGSRNEYEAFWGKLNFIMAMILIVSSIIYSFFVMSQLYIS